MNAAVLDAAALPQAAATPPGLAAGARFHHIGYATRSIAQDTVAFAALGYAPEGEPFADPLQGVAGRFLHGPGPRIELLENLAGADTLTPWLKTGVKMYHLAWEVPDLDATLAALKVQRARLAARPAPAIAFGGRRICFAMLRNGLLVEYIEQAAGGGPR